MELNPEDLAVRDRYKLLIGCVVPRPIAWVSTISPDGAPNLAPFSFFSGAGSKPMTLLFCPANKPGGSEKDTLRNCKPVSDGGTGEFVVHVVDEAMAVPMAVTAEALEYGESEIELAGLVTEASRLVAPPRVTQAVAGFECRTTQVIRLAPGQPGGGNVVIGQVVHAFIRDGVADERLHVDPEQLQAVGRMGGQDYCLTRDRFSMPRGREAIGSNGPVPDQSPITPRPQ
jgi:flavin reductase (DIM6/NTAB) family NADH-FMN oxidoreductase RutF